MTLEGKVEKTSEGMYKITPACSCAEMDIQAATPQFAERILKLWCQECEAPRAKCYKGDQSYV